MARFRAYSTDSEDDSVLSSNEVGQEDGDASEVASSLHESPQRRRSHFSAQDSDESGMSEDEEDELEIRERMVSPPLASTKGADPSITPWAREVGVDPQKMHVMQASLFRVPEEEAAMKAAAQPISRRQLVLPSAVSRKHSRDSDGDGLRADSRQVLAIIQP
ncbi:hypothetical protein PHLCEN_2v10221 [Hermanssonia centrifuga]|uniref:Uncharacterized protein n=1 Tax=Hermanssonia centrifuga TaxID=98765 RepID=A0A2R6NNK7_9APHY|nr:hypothetical protein PHLCEN_2v10221 [Hermanssonia centrifuga]